MVSPEGIHPDIYEIKDGIPGDERLLAELHREDGLPEDVLSDIASFSKKDFEESAHGKRTILFIFASGRTVGSVQLLHSPRASEFQDGKTGELHFMKVTNSFQGKGISSKLNTTLEQRARKRGMSRLILEVEVTNDHAVDIYRHWGYSVVQENNVDYHTFTMLKDLDLEY